MTHLKIEATANEDNEELIESFTVSTEDPEGYTLVTLLFAVVLRTHRETLPDAAWDLNGEELDLDVEEVSE